MGKEKDVDPSIQIGPRRMAEQLSSFLPGAHLTLISVLQGVALAVLVDGVRTSTGIHPSYWLMYVDSILLISLAWFLYVAAFVGFHWPFNALHTTLQFVLAAAEIYAFVHVSDPRQWLYGLAAFAIIGSGVRFLNTRMMEPVMYVDTDAGRYTFDDDRAVEVHGAAFFAACGVVIATCGAVWGGAGEWTVAIIALALFALLMIMLVMYDRSARESVRTLLSGSDWGLSSWGIVIPARQDSRAAAVQDGADACDAEL